MYDEIFSIFKPIINEVIVVAILLPKRIPILLLNVNILAFIRLIVSKITAELDWIIIVDRNPASMLFLVEEVNFNIFFFIVSKERHDKL